MIALADDRMGKFYETLTGAQLRVPIDEIGSVLKRPCRHTCFLKKRHQIMTIVVHSPLADERLKLIFVDFS
jgi:hypothetical protein